MRHCVQCGHQLGVGRYCTNCGHPVEESSSWRTDTAERGDRPPATSGPVPDGPPPTAWTAPPPARFPLYADEVPGRPEHPHSAPVPDPPSAPPPAAPPVAVPAAAAAAPGPHRRRLGLGIAAAAVTALVAVAAVVGVVLLGGDDDEPVSDETTSDAPQGDDGSGDGGVTNLARTASAEVPKTAAPGQDVDGNPVSFEGEHMLDGVPETAWRMPGDGTGEEIVVTLDAPSHLRSVGMINGYAKKATGRDWYHGNRRVEEVEWVFDDGSTVVQQMGDDTGVQSVEVDVTTSTVTLRLLSVSRPGTGPSARDFTAISDLSLVGES